jgi:hypothetical protein
VVAALVPRDAPTVNDIVSMLSVKPEHVDWMRAFGALISAISTSGS